MARKLKTYTTSIGFYDLAIAAPSMKAALDTWGARQNLFHEGLAQETDDPEIVGAALKKPGVVLRRAVGTDRPYQEQAIPPSDLPDHASRRAPTPKKPAPVKRAIDSSKKAQKAAIISFEKARAKRDKARLQEEADREKKKAAEERQNEKRQRTTARAQAVLDRAHGRHQAKVQTLEHSLRTIEDRLAVERDRWRKEEQKLQRNIRETQG